MMDAEGIPHDRRPLIIPKIEKPSALRNIDEILALSGGLMVARGDLGVELGLHRVPFAQKFLVRKANDAGKFCITATQVESQTAHPTPSATTPSTTTSSATTPFAAAPRVPRVQTPPHSSALRSLPTLALGR